MSKTRGRPVKAYTEGETRCVHIYLDTETTKLLADYCQANGVGTKAVITAALQLYCPLSNMTAEDVTGMRDATRD